MKLKSLAAVASAAALLVIGTTSAADAKTGKVSDQTVDTSLTAKVVVGDAVTTRGVKKLRVDVYYSYDGDSIKPDSSNYVTAQSRSGYYFDMFDLYTDSRTHEHGYITLKGTDPAGTYDLGLYSSADVGYSDYDNYLDDWTDETDYYYLSDDSATTFHVRRNSAITLNASPEPVKKNHYVTVKGNLKRLWTDGYSTAYHNASKQRVKVYFDPTGKSPKKYVGSTTTNTHGNYSRAFKQKVSGTWSAVYSGTGTYASDSARDAVKVRR